MLDLLSHVLCSLQLSHGGDGDVLLVAIAKELENGAVREAAQTLMQDKYKVVSADTTLMLHGVCSVELNVLFADTAGEARLGPPHSLHPPPPPLTSPRTSTHSQDHTGIVCIQYHMIYR